MKILKTTDIGGFPFRLNDIRWMQDGAKETDGGVLSWLGDNFIISGCALTQMSGSTYKVTEGWFILNGEVCRMVESDTFNITSSYLYVEAIDTYDASGLKSFEDSSQHDTYYKGECQVKAYGSTQTGKVGYNATTTAETMMNTAIQGYNHAFTKRQSWAVVPSDVLSAGSEIIPMDNTPGNLLVIDVTAGDTVLTRFSSSMPNGTWFGVLFIGTGTIKIGTGSSTNPIKTNGVNYSFSAGDIAWFIVYDGGHYLVNGRRVADWHIVGDTGEPAYQNSWSGYSIDPLRYRVVGNRVYFSGAINKAGYTTDLASEIVFVLPAGLWPTCTELFVIMDGINETYGLLSIQGNGEVRFKQAGLSAAALHPFLSPVSFFID